MHRFTLKIYFVFAFLFFGYARLFAQEFPTIDRVLYVNECVREQGSSLDSLYKCSCVMDYFTENLSYAEFDHMDASSHGIQTTGERSALWRDPKGIRDGINKLKKIEMDAKMNCNILEKKP